MKRLLKDINLIPSVTYEVDSKIYIDAASHDINDASFLKNSVERQLHILVSSFSLGKNWYFDAAFTGSSYAGQPEFVINTNLNFNEINRIYHLHVSPDQSSITPAWLLTHILAAQEAVYLASTHLAELMFDQVSSSIMRQRFLSLLQKRDRNIREIDLFTSIVLPNSSNIRDIIDKKERSFKEFLDLLDNSDNFRRFVANQNPDKKLIQSYMEEIKKVSWLDRLPSKTSRFFIANGLGFALDIFLGSGVNSVALALGYSAMDTFLLDRIINGWKPNQFIDDKLLPFVSE
jgi:hypothetical protein